MLKRFITWVRQNDTLNRGLHTFWQAFLAALLVSAGGVHDISTARAVVLAAVAAGLSAVKSVLINR